VGISATSIRHGALTLGLLLGTAGAALAQNVASPTIPGLEHFSLPGTRQTSTPPATPTPSATPRAAPPVVRTVPPAARSTPTPHTTPTPRPTATSRPVPVTRPTPAPRPTPTAAATPRPPLAPVTPAPRPSVAAPVATPAPVATTPTSPATPSAAPTELPPVEPSRDETPPNPRTGIGDLLPTVAIAAAVVAVLALMLWFFRRRRGEDRFDHDEEEDARGRADGHERFDLGLGSDTLAEQEPEAPATPAAAAPEPSPFVPVTNPVAAPPDAVPTVEEVVVPPPAPPVADRAMLDIALHPRRAGTNLTSAAVEYDVIVRNSGGAAASNVRLDVRLLTAEAQQDALINALFSEAIERPITPPFELPPGEEVKLGGMGILPRERISTMTVEGRALFVPVITVNLVYDWANGTGQTARSFVIGIERRAGARMGAFRLDEVRMYSEVGAIEYTIAVDR